MPTPESSTSWQKFYEPLFQIAEATFAGLDQETAGRFVDIANDWIDIHGALLDTSTEKELTESLIFLQFQGLFKEIYWLQLMFLGGNYALLQGRLRFVWELIFHAYLADNAHRTTPGQPSRTLDEKVAWLDAERGHWGWKGIREALERLLPRGSSRRIDLYHRLWGRLNKQVHPSPTLLDRLTDTSALLVRDAFDERWARQSVEAATDVFDLVWLTVFRCFPRAAGPAFEKGLLVNYPVTLGLSRGRSRRESVKQGRRRT